MRRQMVTTMYNNYSYCVVYTISISIFISILLVKEENAMIILRNPQIAELIEAGGAFKSNVMISKNETKK